MKFQKAFTLMELIIVIAITTILASIGVSTYINQQRAKSLDSTAQEIVGYLRYAQQKSMTQEGGNQWGIHFENPVDEKDFYALYTGATYTSPEETRYLSKGLEFQLPSSGNTVDISFSKLTGNNYTETEQEVIINLTGSQIARVIRVMPNGVITSGEGEKGYWKFDEGSGNFASDDTIYKNTGTLVNSPTWKVSSNCISGTCLEFDGSTNYLNCGNDSSLDNENALSVEFWIKTSFDAPFPGECGLVKKGTGSAVGWSDAGWSFRLRDDIPAFALRKKDDSGYWDLYQGEKVIDGQWHHIVGTFDTSGIKKYVDGVLTQQASTGQPYLVTNGDCEIGRIGAYFNGFIDQVHVYNRVLNAAEIKQHYKARN